MIYIEVRGGVVVAAYSSDKDRLVVIDHDQPSGEDVVDYKIDPIETMPEEVFRKLRCVQFRRDEGPIRVSPQ